LKLEACGLKLGAARLAHLQPVVALS